MTVLLSWLLAAILAAVLLGGWVLRVMWQASRRRTRPGRAVDLWRPQPQMVFERDVVDRLNEAAMYAHLEVDDRWRDHMERMGF